LAFAVETAELIKNMRAHRRHPRAAAFKNPHPALAAGTTAAARRTDKYSRPGQRAKKLSASRHLDGALVVDDDLDITLRQQHSARAQNQKNQAITIEVKKIHPGQFPA